MSFENNAVQTAGVEDLYEDILGRLEPFGFGCDRRDACVVFDLGLLKVGEFGFTGIDGFTPSGAGIDDCLASADRSRDLTTE